MHDTVPLISTSSNSILSLGPTSTPLRSQRVAGRRPLRVMFVITSMPVGGAETLLANLVRRMNRNRCLPEIACLKQRGPLGDELQAEVPVHSQLIHGKYDVLVLQRLKRLFRERKTDAVITVGAGDKMFWGRVAARWAKVPVVLSALHSTGWPDGIGRMNRCLTPLTDGFIAVAPTHAKFLVQAERFPESKVFTVPNGIDVDRFEFDQRGREQVRRSFGIPDEAPVVGIVAALRPEKNHELFVQVAAQVLRRLPQTHFLIVGDGPQRAHLESSHEVAMNRHAFHFLGCRGDIPQVLSAMDLFTLTSHNEANPVSILEAMACRRPVVAPDVGSIADSVIHGETGFLVQGHPVEKLCEYWLKLLQDRSLAESFGNKARTNVVQHGSLDAMTSGYEQLIWSLFDAKSASPKSGSTVRQ